MILNSFSPEHLLPVLSHRWPLFFTFTTEEEYRRPLWPQTSCAAVIAVFHTLRALFSFVSLAVLRTSNEAIALWLLRLLSVGTTPLPSPSAIQPVDGRAV